MREALLLALFLVVLTVPVFCAARFGYAIFSPKLRETIRKQWLSHTLLAAASLAIVLALFWEVTVAVDAVDTHIKLVKTRNEASYLTTAILSYETEYGEAPAKSENAALVKILTGDNQRGIAFLMVSPSEMNAKGDMIDAWQKPFRISLADPDHPVIVSDMAQSVHDATTR